MLAYAVLFFTTTILFVIWTLIKEKKYSFALDLLFGSIIFVFVGFRYRVGGDWNNYNNIFNNYIVSGLSPDFDPAFQLIIQVAAAFDHSYANLIINIYYISLFLIFFYMFNYLYLKKKFSVLQIAWVIFPIFLFLQATGYMRQAVACVFIIPISYYSLKKQYPKSITFVLLSALFHKSALVYGFMPLFYFFKFDLQAISFFIKSKKMSRWTICVALIFLIFILGFFLRRWGLSYINGQLASKGVALRLLYLLALLSPILWLSRQNLLKTIQKYWLLFLILTGLFVVVCYYFSTLIDRYLLYFYIPAAIYVISRLSPDNRANRQLVSFYVGMFMVNSAYIIFWLKYSYHGSTKWIPFCHMWLGCYQ